MQVDKNKVGERIRQIRKQNGYSMEQFGKQIGDAPRGSVNSWEKGVNLPNKERLDMISIMGNTTTDELLYGTFSEYISELIYKNLGVKLSYHFTEQFAEQLKMMDFTYGDDVAILRFVKGMLNANNVATLRPSLFYKCISEQEDLFIGYLQVEENKSEPKFIVFADVKEDRLHVLPYILNESFEENYLYPSQITEPGEHDYFTSGFLALHLSLREFTMVYYGLDIEGQNKQISQFTYDVDSDALILNTGDTESFDLYEPFVKCIEKELLYRKYSS